MASNGSNNIRVGIDIGTSKVVCLIAEYVDLELRVIGLGSQTSQGLKNGVIVDIESTVSAIESAVNDAELMSGKQVTSAFVGISGGHINGLNSEGVVGIKDKKVKVSDVDRVITAAQAYAIPDDSQLLHVLPRDYIIDQQNGIREPLGMAGVRLETKVHLVTCNRNSAQNISSCMKACGITVEGFVLEQLASSYSVLSEDEKELGTCLIDMGGGTSDVAVFQNGAISHTANIPTSGDHITKDIARALQTPSLQAEELKKKYGCASSSIIHENETIEVPGMAGRKNKIFSRMALASVIEQRYLDIFGLIKQKLNLSSLENNIPAGIVITGGTSRMEGVAQLAEEVFNAPVRIGSPSGLIGLSDILRNPIYATAVGLVLYSQKSQEEDHMNYLFMKDKNIFNKAFRWIQNNF